MGAIVGTKNVFEITFFIIKFQHCNRLLVQSTAVSFKYYMLQIQLKNAVATKTYFSNYGDD